MYVTPIDFMAIISSIKIQNLVDVTLLITCITMHKVSLPMNLKKEFLSFLDYSKYGIFHHTFMFVRSGKYVSLPRRRLHTKPS